MANVGSVIRGTNVYNVTLLPHSKYVRKCHSYKQKDDMHRRAKEQVLNTTRNATVVHCRLPKGEGTAKAHRLQAYDLWRLQEHWQEDLLYYHHLRDVHGAISPSSPSQRSRAGKGKSREPSNPSEGKGGASRGADDPSDMDAIIKVLLGNKTLDALRLERQRLEKLASFTIYRENKTKHLRAMSQIHGVGLSKKKLSRKYLKAKQEESRSKLELI